MKSFLFLNKTVLALAFCCSAPNAWAHRLDECLLASRIDIMTAAIILDIDVTPGVAVLPEFLSWVDTDKNGVISQGEGDDYARSLLEDCTLLLDDELHDSEFLGATVPSSQALAEGIEKLRVKAQIPVRLTNGHHIFAFYCAHHPEICVYLSNALLPTSEKINVVRQTRDLLQRRIEVRFKCGVRGQKLGQRGASTSKPKEFWPSNTTIAPPTNRLPRTHRYPSANREVSWPTTFFPRRI
ncbi:MAG: hypothetical protein M2R45_02965 [Verrucomicrobia subdivision 3 bacterium]|nr:hypothetical protein [Limisphaerales bacterium]MCS1415315.1 hypothetical protein [Limisphaerales bacterium]